MPDSIRLNTDGNAKAKIKVAPPSSEDRTFGGSVTFHAIIDQKGFDDVRDGTFESEIQKPLNYNFSKKLQMFYIKTLIQIIKYPLTQNFFNKT